MLQLVITRHYICLLIFQFINFDLIKLINRLYNKVSQYQMEQYISELIDKKFKQKHLSAKNIARYRFVCKCSFSIWRRNRFDKHTDDCEQFKSSVISSMLQENKVTFLKQFQQQLKNRYHKEESSVHVNKRMYESQTNCKKFQNLEVRLVKLEEELGYDNKRYRLHNQVQMATKKCLETLQQPIMSQLKISIEPIMSYAIERKLDLNQVFIDLHQGIIEKMAHLKLQDCIDEYRKNLSQFNEWLLKERKTQSVSQKTIKRDRDGFQFWKRFKKVNRLNLIQVLQELRNINSSGISSALIYYRKMICSGFFVQLPQIPKNFSTRKIIKKQKIRISIDIVRSQVHSLIKQQQFIKACDLWYCVSMGLRSADLLDVPLQNIQGQFFDIVKIVQSKNQNQTIRVIPMSLKLMTKRYNIPYPLSKDRLRSVREHCIRLFGRFYSLRSTCLTMIFRSLFEANQFAKFHRSYQTSIRYYVDLDSKQAINKGFELADFSESQTIPDSGLMISKQDNRWIEKRYESSIEQFNLDENVFTQEEEKEDLVFLGEDYIDQTQISSLQLNQLKYEMRLASEGVEINQRSFESLEDCLEWCLKDKECNDMVKEYENFLEETRSQDECKSFEQKIEDIYDVSLNITDIQESGPVERVVSSHTSTQKIFVLSVQEEEQTKFKSNFLHLQKRIPSPLNIELRKKVFSRKNKVSVDYFYKRKKPNCQHCGEEMIEKQCQQHFFFECVNGHSIEHDCSSQHFIQGAPKIITESLVEVSTGINEINYLKARNNFDEYITEDQRTTKYIYHSTVPLTILTKMNYLDQKTEEIIEKNIKMEDYLPLRICNSKKQEGGLGVFATSTIPPSTLICTYLGEIGTNQSCQFFNDSLYSLGYIMGSLKFLELIIIPKQFKNIGRFINSSQSRVDANCKPSIGLRKTSKQDMEFILYFTSIRQIKAGDQLQYYYGHHYWNLEDQKNNASKGKQLKNQFIQQKTEERSLIMKANQGKKITQEEISQLLKEPVLQTSCFSVKAGRLRSLKYLIMRYPNRDCKSSLQNLKKQFGYYCPIKGDGNCAYRSLAINYLKFASFDKQSDIFRPIKILITNQLGKTSQFKELQSYCFVKFIEPLRSISNEGERETFIINSLNNSQILDSVIISYSRSICYEELIENRKKYENFNSFSIEARVLSYACQAQQPEVVILSNLFQLSTSIVYFTNVSSQSVRIWNLTSFPTKKQVYLFYRPGHYQLIYPTGSVSLNRRKIADNFTNKLLENQEYIQIETQKVFSQQLTELQAAEQLQFLVSIPSSQDFLTKKLQQPAQQVIKNDQHDGIIFAKRSQNKKQDSKMKKIKKNKLKKKKISPKRTIKKVKKSK